MAQQFSRMSQSLFFVLYLLVQDTMEDLKFYFLFFPLLVSHSYLIFYMVLIDGLDQGNEFSLNIFIFKSFHDFISI